MRKKININTSYLAGWMRNYYFQLLGDQFEFVENATNPDYILVSASHPNFIRGEEYVHHQYLNEFPKAAIRIFLQHEAVGIDINLVDYAVLYTDDLKLADRVFFANFCSAGYFQVLGENIFERLSAPREDARKLLSEKDAFCNFMYSHGGVPEREQLFRILSNYRFVESQGKFLNNINPEEKRRAKSHYESNNWFEEGIEIKSNSKFSIAVENALHPTGYYISEKIMSAMLANTIPIYWGNPKVGDVFNSRAIINCHDYASFDDVLQRVMEIDQNDDLWCEMMAEPWMTQEQYLKASGNQEQLRKFLSDIFSSPIESARRRPRGCWASRYESTKRNLLVDAVKYRAQSRVAIPTLRAEYCQRLDGMLQADEIETFVADLRLLFGWMSETQRSEFLAPEANPRGRIMSDIADSRSNPAARVRVAAAFYHGGRKWGVEMNRIFSVRWLRAMVEEGILLREDCPPEAFLLWGMINMRGEPPIIERNLEAALECFSKIEGCSSPRIRNRAIYRQALVHFKRNDINEATQAVTRLLLSHSIAKNQMDLLVDILGYRASLSDAQKDAVRSGLKIRNIDQLASWKRLDSMEFPWKFRWNLKRLIKSLGRHGYFSTKSESGSMLKNSD